MSFTEALFSEFFSAIDKAPVRIIADERFNSVLVERIDDSHSLTAKIARRFARVLHHTAPRHVLLVDYQDLLAGVHDLATHSSVGPDRVDSIHALCFASGPWVQVFEQTRQRKIGAGLWEVAWSSSHPTHWKGGDMPELAMLQGWLESIQKSRHTPSINLSPVEIADASDQRDDDDGAPSHNTSSPNSLRQLMVVRNRLRNEVHMMSADDWSELSGNRGKNPSAALGKYKSSGRLFAVPDGKRDLYPAFQFSEMDAKPKAVMATVLRYVPESARGWPLLSWFNAPNVFLKDQKPLEVIDSDPQAVADAADRFFGRDD